MGSHLDNGLETTWRQIIIYANDDPVYLHICDYESHGIHGKKKYQSIEIPFIANQSELHSSVCLDKLLTYDTYEHYSQKQCRVTLMTYGSQLYIILILLQYETRQHSTQSVGNMPPPSPRHLLPHVLRIMPRNPKYDKFQPKGPHNEENAWKPQILPVSLSQNSIKIRKIYKL